MKLYNPIYKVVTVAKRKNAVRHVAAKGTYDDCREIFDNINKDKYYVTIEDFKGTVWCRSW